MPSPLPFLVALHVLGAGIWVGGQLALAPMTSAARAALGREAARPVLRELARRAQPLLWAGLALAVLSGLALLYEERGFAWSGLPFVKLALAFLSGGGAALHTISSRRGWSPALTGGSAALALLAGLGLLVAGAMLRYS